MIPYMNTTTHVMCENIGTIINNNIENIFF